ncbi:cytidine deaminase [Aminivibrio sp.]|jgi:cytidine deaminase|uniref:cytidine deaminase n=1 Tax=Aminivibrio sp. TaxID=1872489 RepID=UPI001A5547A0|nr:cytidine deaminase [Aminivibrio sp.]MBL3538315.1 cytidine deaminase [Aminivibrio sp.]MDK2958990.1 cytidine deaminase [Synergistaceae bacterium]
MTSLNLDPFRTLWPEDYPPAEGLLLAAEEARALAYAPYSRFSVGAALLVEGRSDFVTGCNVENASYGLSLCAERNAAGTLAASGGGKPLAVAIAGAAGEPCLPCGACRQFLAEFNPSMLVVLREGAGTAVLSLAALFPVPFLLEREPRS